MALQNTVAASSEKLQFNKVGETNIITKSQPYVAGFFLALIGGAAIYLTVLGPGSTGLVEIIIAIIGIVMLYFGLLIATGKQKIELSPERIELNYGPLPTPIKARQPRSYSRDNIADIKLSEFTTTSNQIRTKYYAITLHLKDGKESNLITLMDKNNVDRVMEKVTEWLG
ncbi:hypothetical protein [Neolewinella antarctica]|uniref:Photosystem I assembly protein Ycf4 n=1 Tax=Neolewinella antarctica TaxID=442734 RepID=A0ABX0X846_9BACT|nr:hypothetical protein [Neolewinella antarctica]NJC25419.1 hypothetical protein [Neolewinella antarctica]